MAIHSADQIIKRVSFESGALLNLTNAKQLLRVQAKTAAYTLLESDSGTFFTTYGASGSVTFTLPANPTAGLHYWFLNGTTSDLVVAAATADTLYAYADAAADSVASTDIAVLMLAIADGNKWYVVSFGNSTVAAATAVVTT